MKRKTASFTDMDAAITDLKGRLKSFHEQMMFVVSTVSDLSATSQFFLEKERKKKHLEAQLKALENCAKPALATPVNPYGFSSFEPSLYRLEPSLYREPPSAGIQFNADLWPENPSKCRILPKWPKPPLVSYGTTFKLKQPKLYPRLLGIWDQQVQQIQVTSTYTRYYPVYYSKVVYSGETSLSQPQEAKPITSVAPSP